MADDEQYERSARALDDEIPDGPDIDYLRAKYREVERRYFPEPTDGVINSETHRAQIQDALRTNVGAAHRIRDLLGRQVALNREPITTDISAELLSVVGKHHRVRVPARYLVPDSQHPDDFLSVEAQLVARLGNYDHYNSLIEDTRSEDQAARYASERERARFQLRTLDQGFLAALEAGAVQGWDASFVDAGEDLIRRLPTPGDS